MEMLKPRYISEEEYAEMEEIADEKHEYFDGQVFAMAGGTNRHAVICANTSRALGNALQGKPCRAVGGEQRVKIEATGLQTYPDALVYCPDARFAGKGNQMLLSPVVLIEVLSPRTQEWDRGGKFEHYKKLPSLRDYLLVTQAYVWVERRQKTEAGDWLLKTYNSLDQTIALESIDCQLSLADLYDGIEIPAALPLRFPTLDEDE